MQARALGRDPLLWLAFGLGTGLAPRAPGTAGTLLGVLLHMGLLWLPPLLHYGVVAVVVLAGIGLSGYAARCLGVHDHPGIVWDEIAGFVLAMCFAPSGWQFLLAGFVLFRLFDIVKPWPIRWIDRRVHGGVGIMLDDLLAGMFTGVLLWLMNYYAILPLAW